MTQPALKPLTRQEQRFIEEYLVDFNAGAAWVRAGHSANGARQTAHAALKRPSIAAAIDAGMAKKSAETKCTKEWLVAQVIELTLQAKQTKASQVLLRSLELLARLHGYITEHRNVRVIRSVTDMTDDELAAVVAEAERSSTAAEPRH